jgi:hypothetical protein
MGGRAQGVAPEIKFAGDSLLEEARFEPSVPPKRRGRSEPLRISFAPLQPASSGRQAYGSAGEAMPR